MKYCAHCKNGDIKREADYFIKGKVWRDNERTIPYKAYICKDHYEMLCDDDAELRIEEYISPSVRNERAKELIFNNTMFESVAGFLASTPTLRKKAFTGVEWLRKYYKEETGKVAAR